jgi:chitosanase
VTEIQQQTIKAIVNIFETGRVTGDYGAVTLLKGDSGHLTYGRSQTTLASGNLFLLIKAYCDRSDAKLRSEFQPFLGDLAACNVELDTNLSLRELLKEAGDDEAMRKEQDRFFDAVYYQPACRAAAAKGIALPLGLAVVYDSFIHGAFRRVAPMAGTPIGTGVDEKQWIGKYVAARKIWLQGLKDPLPKTVYRMDSFNKMITDNAWDLPLPLKVRGVMITEEDMREPFPVVRAMASDPSDPPPARILRMTTPYMRGEDVRRVQEALNSQGFANSRDSIFGPFTEALVKRFQQSRQIKHDGVVGPTTLSLLGL